MHAATIPTAPSDHASVLGSACVNEESAEAMTLVCAPDAPPAPVRAGTCCRKMIVAIPRVNPSMTGHGMNDTARPSRATPARTTRTPAMSVTTATAPTPCFATIGARTTTMAPVGPDTWTCEPPNTAATSPATIAVTSPASAPAPDAMPKPSARGSATMPTVSPASRSPRHERGSSA